MRYARARVFLDHRSRAFGGGSRRGGARARCSSADGARAREGTRWGWGNLMLDELSIRMDAREEGTTDARGFVWDEGWW